VEAVLTPLANPVGDLAAAQGSRLLVGSFDAPRPDRDALALGALLAGYASDAAHYGLHHVLSQTLVRHAGIGHGAANAIMLPHTARALTRRFPDRMERLAGVVGDDIPSVAARLLSRTGRVRLRELGVTAEQIGECADQASARPELDLTPPRADREEIAALYEEAW
jgi:alcohol dehydrogenase class IV